MGSIGRPGGVWATTPSCDESRRQPGFYKQLWCPLYNGARCITCLLVHWAGAGKEPVGRTVLRGFALRAGFLALGKLCKQGAAPHPVLLSAWPPLLPSIARHGMPDRVLGLHRPCRSL